MRALAEGWAGAGGPRYATLRCWRLLCEDVGRRVLFWVGSAAYSSGLRVVARCSGPVAVVRSSEQGVVCSGPLHALLR